MKKNNKYSLEEIKMCQGMIGFYSFPSTMENLIDAVIDETDIGLYLAQDDTKLACYNLRHITEYDIIRDKYLVKLMLL